MTTASPALRAGATVVAPARAETIARLVGGGIALLMLFAAFSLPLWQAELQAPQYPEGLKMTAYGDRVVGDIEEINLLNHYIGMRPLRWNEIPERTLWLPAVAAAAVAVVVGTLRRGWLRKVFLIGLWAFPIGVVADIQFRLFQYGHDLDPAAALRVPEFTVWVVGPTKVWNFSTWSWPGLGLIALFVMAAAVTFAPWAGRRIREATARS